MNSPLYIMSVVHNVSMTRLSVSGVSRWRKLTGGGDGTCGSIVPIPSAEAMPSAATNHIAVRQSPKPLNAVPIGEPRAVALVSPVMTTARALPRRSGGTSDAPTDVAIGLNIAAPNPATSRLTNKSVRVGARAVATLPMMNTASPLSSSRLRGQCAVTAAMMGESTAYEIAYNVTI